MRVGVINHEIGEYGICSGPAGCTTVNLSCRYLDAIPRSSVHLVPFHSEEEAIHEIEQGNLWGYLSFPHNFSIALVDRELNGKTADNISIYESRIQIQMDMSSKLLQSPSWHDVHLPLTLV